MRHPIDLWKFFYQYAVPACGVFYIFGHKMILVQVEKNITESTISPKYKFGNGINCERGKIVGLLHLGSLDQ